MVRVFFCLFQHPDRVYLQHISACGCVVSICRTYVVKLMKMYS